MRDDFPKLVVETLAKRVSNHCSNPTCRKRTSGPHTEDDKALNVGVAAHITAASPGGPRYDPLLTPEERKSIVNGIWLCQFCAKLVDNDEARYANSLLVKWKQDAEQEARKEIESTKTVYLNTQIINKAETEASRQTKQDVQRLVKNAGMLTSELRAKLFDEKYSKITVSMGNLVERMADLSNCLTPHLYFYVKDQMSNSFATEYIQIVGKIDELVGDGLSQEDNIVKQIAHSLLNSVDGLLAKIVDEFNLS